MEQKLGIEIDSFAYPFGKLSDISKEAYDFVKKKYKFAFFNVRGGLYESPSSFFLYRQNISPTTPVWLARSMVSGKLDWIYRKQRAQAEKQFNSFY